MSFSQSAISELDDTNTTSEAYWAAQEAKLTVRDAHARILEWGRAQDYSGRTWRWVQSLRTYYTADTAPGGDAGSQIRVGGEQGELIVMRVNEARNFALHVINLVTSDVLNYAPVSHDEDAKSQAANDLARKLLNAMVREKHLGKLRRRAAEIAFVADSGYVVTTWDVHAGDPGAPQVVPGADPSQPPKVIPTRKGDVRIEVFEPWNVVYDLRPTHPDRDWYCLRRWTNRWDLIARYPDMREDILKLRTRDQQERGLHPLWLSSSKMHSEEVCVWEFYHRKSPSIPNGRMMRFCDEDTVFTDGPLPYSDIPIREVRVADMIDASYGYTSWYDILGLATAYDATWSSIATTADMAGVANILVPEQSSMAAPDMFTGGGRVWEYRADPNLPDGGAPKYMDLPPVAEVHLKLVQEIPKTMGMILSVNETVRGAPPPEAKTASGQALQVEQTASFWTPFRQSIIEAWELVGADILDCFSNFADQERVIEIEGKQKGMETLSFMGDDLKGMRKVRVDVGGPASDSPSGRRALLEFIVTNFPGRLTADDIIQFNRTGILEPILDPEAGTDELIQYENQFLSTYAGPVPDLADPSSMHGFSVALGAKVPVDPEDDHPRHIQGHRRTLRDPKIRMNPGAVAAIHAHINAHREFEVAAQAQMMQMSMQAQAGAVQTQGPPGKPGEKPMGEKPEPKKTGVNGQELPNVPKRPPGAPEPPAQAPGGT